MGLDTTHNCWHGPYGAFAEWRRELARLAWGIKLEDMEGFGGETSWDEFKKDPLEKLINHSDCDGHIANADCLDIAMRLESIAPDMPHRMYDDTVRFADGLMDAHDSGEDVEFH